MSPNWIELAGVVNMRDLGGLRTDTGETVQQRRLLRSDNLQDLPAASVRTLVEAYHLTDVIDLRTHLEVETEGAGPLRGEAAVRHHHLTLYRDQASDAALPLAQRRLPWENDPLPAAGPQDAKARTDDAENRPAEGSGHGHDAFWSEHYLSYLSQRPDSVLAALAAIANSTGSAVVHCAAGKDRTGTVVGVALRTVGVLDDQIIADFAASAERVPLILERLRTRPAYAAGLATKTVAQQSPTTDTMRLLLTALDERYGGVHRWLAEHDWSPRDTERLRRKLLAP